MSHDDDITGTTRAPLGRDVARTVSSVRSNHAPEQRGKPVTGPRRQDDRGAGQRPRRAAGDAVSMHAGRSVTALVPLSPGLAPAQC